MIEIQTQKNTVKVFTDKLDQPTKAQIAATARDPAYADAKIRIMPDTHAGRACVIGLTMTLNGRVSPSLVGVDIGCGMEVVKLEDASLDPRMLDELIRTHIPAGKRIHDIPQNIRTPLKELICRPQITLDRVMKSMGTLGGGNHFIEVDHDENGTLYLVIHSGSRSLGVAVADHYRNAAYQYHLKKARRTRRVESYDRLEMEIEMDDFDIERFGVDIYGDTPRARSGFTTTKATRRDDREQLPVKWETATCEGKLYEAYLHDLAIAVQFAEENRRAIAERICAGLHLHVAERFSCPHNYIDDHHILRKGAISARLGERVFIPLNMRDGALLGRGLGNPDWNFSAPHGAGRACSRTDARHAYDVETYQTVMKEAGIYTTTATKETLDECPMAYKSMERILPHLPHCVMLEAHLKPLYNFKAKE